MPSQDYLTAMSTGYAAWAPLFRKAETLSTTFKKNPFVVVAVTRRGIDLSIPGKVTDRSLTLAYGHLDALWKAKDFLHDCLSNRQHLTTTVNGVWKDAGLKLDWVNEAQYWALVCEREKREPDEVSLNLPDEHANPFKPKEGDYRAVIERQIRERRGQTQFRNRLIKRYGKRCLVTGCTAQAVLEAAHINPYRGEKDNHVDNGLLLRSDIHTLFDLNLLGIEPVHLRVQLHPSLAKEYAQIAGAEIRVAPALRPSQAALSLRYIQFQRRKRSD